MDKFINYAEIQAEKAENLSFCRGIKLLHIRDKVETMLSFIGKGGMFEEYTVHSIAHIDQMLKIVEWLIPESTKAKLTYAEWLMLTLAIYFHDLGMVVTRDEYEHRNNPALMSIKKKYCRIHHHPNMMSVQGKREILFYIKNLYVRITLLVFANG